MIEKMTQYVVKCDSCGKRSGVHHDENSILGRCLADGWQGCQLPAAELLFSCPACVSAKKFPPGWDSKEAKGDNQG